MTLVPPPSPPCKWYDGTSIAVPTKNNGHCLCTWMPVKYCVDFCEAFTAAHLAGMRSDKLMVDVGAAYGWKALIARRHGNPVLSFECRHDEYERIAKFRDSLSDSYWSVEHGCLSNVSGTGTLYRAHHSSSLTQSAVAGGRERKLADREKNKTEAIPLFRLDSFLRESKPPFGGHWPPVGFLKVDTQGHEPQVLSGALEMIRRDRPIVNYEDVFTAAALKRGGLLNELLGGAETLKDSLSKLSGFEDLFFSPQFLEARPLLHAMQQDRGSVLLIDEIDKSDEAFEAFLLEVLSDYQVTVPEIGTIRANVPPLVILTSNNVRELGDALKRRCLHLHIGFPDHEREQRIVRARVDGISDTLLNQLVRFVQSVRETDIKKRPSIAETVDWARTLLLLHAATLDEAFVRDTLNVLLKHESDIAAVSPAIGKMVREATGPDGRGRLASGYPDMG